MKEEEYFYHARDFQKDENILPHWGSHMHAHLAEFFKNEIDKYVKN